MSDGPICLLMDRGEARGVVEILEAAAPGHRFPMRVMDIARRLEAELGEPRPYPELPRRRPLREPEHVVRFLEAMNGDWL